MVTLGGDRGVGKVERVLSPGLGSVARKKMKSEAVERLRSSALDLSIDLPLSSIDDRETPRLLHREANRGHLRQSARLCGDHDRGRREMHLAAAA
jgi:hypothetical protein